MPAARSGSQRCFCSAVPPWISGNADSSWTHMITPVVASARLNSSIDHHHGDHVAAQTAVLGRVWQCEDVLAGEQLDDVPRKLALGVDLGRTRRDLVAGQLAHRVAQRGLLVVEDGHDWIVAERAAAVVSPEAAAR